MTEGVTQFYVVRDGDEKQATFGETQIRWLAEQGLIRQEEVRAAGPTTAVALYLVVGDETVFDIHERVIAEPSLSECDFCRAKPAKWRQPVNLFHIDLGPAESVPFGRDVFLCDDCQPLVTNRDRAALIERSMNATIDYALAKGGATEEYLSGLTRHQMKTKLFPRVRVWTMKVLGNRKGYAERIG